MKFKGLTTQQVAENRDKFGSNALTHIPLDPLWKKFVSGLADPMLVILLVALAIQFILVLFQKAEWYEPFGVLIAILVADGVSALSEYRQEGKASALKAEEEAKETTKLIRDGELREEHVGSVVVGDIVLLQAGDKIPADGEIIDGGIKVDQAVLNGETEEAEKRPKQSGETVDTRDLLNASYIYRGTVVCSGEAFMEVAEVGDKTLFGRLALEVQEGTRATPLQVKLGDLAKKITVFGYFGASSIVIGIIAETLLGGALPPDIGSWLTLLLNAVAVAVTIIVCAVPEGLPMLTSILLSLQSIRMAKDNVLVRKINGLETAGSINLLLCDKTGTITEGRLSVAGMATGGAESFESLEDAPELARDIKIGIGLNNGAAISGSSAIGGNSTDRALLDFIIASGAAGELPECKKVGFEAFDSAKKYSSITLENEGKTEIFIKGAPEKILEMCNKFTNKNGELSDFTDKSRVTGYIDAQASRSMRLLAVAKREISQDENGYTLICVVCIRDNVRADAADAIREVSEAGVHVVMITGDRKETAVAIARDSGLIRSESDVVLTSAGLAEKSDDELKAILPELRVVARALPSDKSRLVRVAQELDMVVGMTGDGVNDSPALKKADVGFAMGSGTEVAKAAGDITILDDRFLSIDRAILYGRTMFKSIRKFLIFQLTVNVAAVLTCFLGPIIGKGGDYNVIMTVVQLLLVNIVMDSLAAIAYGSEPALPEFMKEKPVQRSASIVSREMLSQILTSALYITAASLSILFVPQIRSLFGDADVTYLKSALFATFMMSITFNGFNARTTHINIFKGLGKNRNFLIVMLSIILFQFLFVTFGGKALAVESLSPEAWGICLLLSLFVIPVDIARKLLVRALGKKG